MSKLVLAEQTKREFKKIVREAWNELHNTNKYNEVICVNVTNNKEIKFAVCENYSTVFTISRNESWNDTIRRAYKTYELALLEKEADDIIQEMDITDFSYLEDII